jgi:hypothetical protein
MRCILLPVCSNLTNGFALFAHQEAIVDFLGNHGSQHRNISRRIQQLYQSQSAIEQWCSGGADKKASDRSFFFTSDYAGLGSNNFTKLTRIEIQLKS